MQSGVSRTFLGDTMQITVEEVEKIKENFGEFEVFAAHMHQLIGDVNCSFEHFCSDLNSLIVDLACGPDTPTQILDRVRSVFHQAIRNRRLLRRSLPDPHMRAYRDFLEAASSEKKLGLEKRTIRSLTCRHAHVLREFIARYPFKNP